jgi:hypothetical protein
MKLTTSLHDQSFNTAQDDTGKSRYARPEGRILLSRAGVALAIAVILAACGGGSDASGGTDMPISLATVSTGHASATTTPVSTTPATTTTTPPSATPVVGTVLTDIRLQNTGGAQTNVPFTFGQVFPVGVLNATDGLIAKLSDGTTLPLQVDVKATHTGGSVRHAIISGVLPSLAGGKTQTLQLAKSTALAKSTVTPQNLVTAGLSGNISITLDKVKYTASLADALATATPINWLSGPVANEWIVSVPLKNAAGVAHPLLNARFDVRCYSGLTKQARVEFVVENTKTFTAGARNFTYDVDLDLGGKSVFSKTGLTHYQHSRWHQIAWWNAAQAPAVNIQHNTAYLIASKAIPNYDQTTVPSENAIAEVGATVSAANTGPMTIGPVLADMGTTGGRPDIGPLPNWSVTYLLTMDKRAKDAMMAAADGSGTWSIHYRDETTTYPVRADNDANRNLSTHGNLSSTGPLPVPRCANNDNSLCNSPYMNDTAHQPSLAYLPYLVTGDYYYLEELQFWAASNPLGTDAGSSGYGQGLVRWMQLRGQAWSLRTLGHVAYITPDTSPLKAYFTKQLDANLDFYNTAYVVGNPNKLHVYDGSGDKAFPVDNSAPWQDDFFTWSFGYLSELGFSKAAPILQWKAQYSVGRMTAPGFCWVAASTYQLKFRDSAGTPIYDSFEKLYRANYAGVTVPNDNFAMQANTVGTNFADLPCGGQAQADWLSKANGYPWALGRMIGYADSVVGYPANMQPALAVAASAGIPDAAKAWSIFAARALKPDYSKAPTWNIVPR